MTILNRWLSVRPWRMYRSHSYLQIKILNSKILNYQSTDYTTILLLDYTKNRQQKTGNRLHHYTTTRLSDSTKNAQQKTDLTSPTVHQSTSSPTTRLHDYPTIRFHEKPSTENDFYPNPKGSFKSYIL